MSSNKQKLFLALSNEAQNCLICENMRDKTAVLSEANGNINPKAIFIAEAPGRQGADRTRKPFYGDNSGANFQILLDSINLKREEIFITNAVLCSPRKPSGANRKPTVKEMRNCSAFLKKQIELINPKIVATLGAVALDAIKTIEYHNFVIRADAGKILDWNGRKLIPLYHPSPQVVASHRRLNEQIADFQALQRAMENL